MTQELFGRVSKASEELFGQDKCLGALRTYEIKGKQRYLLDARVRDTDTGHKALMPGVKRA
eukprot:COSAG02_NODE_6810_length_3349_cov_1.738462_4_plen_61_part_00